MVFHSLQAPRSAVYVQQLVCELREELDLSAFQRAWRRLVARHAVLRTSFHWDAAGEAFQAVHPHVELPLARHDWRGMSPRRRAQALEEYLQHDRVRGFELTAPPLVRLALFLLADSHYRLVWTSHHALLDGRARLLLLQELFRCYEAELEGREPALPPVQPFRDYVEWLQRQDLAPSEQFWRRALAGFAAPTPLAASGTPPTGSDRGSDRRELRLTRQLTTSLHALAVGHELTLNTLIQGAWALLLGRYSGERDVVFGATRACRRLPLHGVESMVGPLINTVPVRARLTPSARLLPWLAELRAAWVAMREHEHTPPTVIRRCSELPGDEPLFESLVVYESRPLEATLRAQGGAWRRRGFRLLGSTNYPLSLTGYQEPRLRLEITYDVGRFTDDAIARMLGHLETILEGMAANPDARLGELPLLSPAEREHVLIEFNRAPAVPDEPACLHAIVEAQADRTPGATAVISGVECLTYDELDRRANRLAHHLRDLGVGPEARVAVCLERSPELVVCLLGILKAGGAYVPLDPAYPAARLQLMVEDAGAAVIVTRRRLLSCKSLSVAAVTVCLDEDRATIDARPIERPIPLAAPDHLAYVLYTSGSTGRPKGVAIAHRSASAFLDWVRLAYSPDDLAGVLAATSISFDLSVFELFAPLSCGGTAILAENALALPTLPAAEQVTLVNIVPSVMTTLLRIGRLPASVRIVNLGGEAVHQHLVREIHDQGPGRRIYNLYGPTEDTTYSTWATLMSDAVGPPPIGRPISGTRCYVLDQQLDLLPAGVPGELYLAGAGLARGYLGRPALTAERFVPDLLSGTPGARMYRTGDRVRWTSDGSLEFLGRVDHQVKIRGHRVEPGEADAALRSHPAVRDCAVVARSDGGEAVLVAYVVTAGPTVPAAELRDFLKQQVPGYLVPTAFVELDALPLTPNGKLDRRALPAPRAPVAESAPALTAPRTPMERLLAGIWQDVLKLERVGIHDDFFELGGHSLVAAQIVARVRAVCRAEVPIRAIFEARTVAELAALVPDGGDEALANPPRAAGRDVASRELPLSFAQERLWFLDQLEPGSAFYNTPTAFRLDGPLDAAALGHALAIVVARHDVLRTTFPAPDGEPRAALEASVDTPLPVIDLTGWPASEREREARRLATEEARRPFDLARGPLFRARLYRLDRDRHLLLVVMHHIVTDAWSLGVLFGELGGIYRAFIGGASPLLKPQPMQYGEYAAWQRERLQDDLLASQLEYWKARLKDAPAVLDLRTDRPRPVKQAFLGARRSRDLPASLIAEVTALSRGERATPFMTFLAAFQTLLYRYTGQQDLVVGAPIANRMRVEAEDMFGLFVNTLALRADLSGNPRFRELLARVRRTTLEDFTHQDLPFQRLVEELASGRDPGRTPLFQVMFQQVRLPTLDLPGLVSTPMEIDRGTAKFDLTLSILEQETGVRACLEYDTALFDDATVVRMLGHYQVLLEGIVAGPDRRLSDLPILSAEDRRQVLGLPQTASRSPQADRCIHQLFEAQVELTPDAPAVVFEDRRLSYRELNAEANRVAHALRRRGVGPEARVGLCVTRSAEMIVGLLGVLKAGGVYVPLDPFSPGERLARILAEAGPPVVLTQGALAPSFDDFRGALIRLDADRESLAEESEANPEFVVPSAAGAYVIYTSGSTGRPKGVVVEHRTLVNYVQGIGRRLELARETTFAMVQPLTVDSSVTVLFPSLCTGGCLHLVSEDRALDAAALGDYFVRNPIDVLKIAPSHLAALQTTRDPGRLLPRRWLVLGGEASQWSWVRELQSLAPSCRILNHYGPTEATVGVLTYLVHERDEPRSPVVPMGRPLPNIRAYLLDGYLNPVPPGVAGELHLAGDCLARGYLGQPGVTAEKFIPDPFAATPGARMYRTGDLARALPGGELEFLGRRDDQVKIRGFRIEPKEIEAALRMHPAVREAAVVARERDGPYGRVLVAYLSCRQPAPDSRELARFLRAKLPEYMIPAGFSILDELPRTPHGKLDRRALPAPELHTPNADNVRTDAGTPVEDLLAAIWAEVLRLDRVGRSENFFELGGHSLLATRVISRVRAVLGAELPVRALFEAPTVAGLAAKIETARRKAAAVPDVPIVPAARPARLPLSHMQQRLWFMHQMNPSSPVHNSPLLLRLTGPLDADALRRAVETIVHRHEALRTTFPLVDGEPVQLVAEPYPVALPLTDLSRLPAADRVAAADRHVREEAARPFDLESGPLVRVRLYRLDAAEHLLLISVHHLLTDGSSASVLLHELSTLYEARTEGRASPLPPLPIQYADFAVWERQRLQGETLDRLLGYWRRQLAGAPFVLELPTDRPRPPVPSHAGARESLALGPELRDRIAALGRSEGVTLFMTVTAAFQALLARYTGQQDIVVGAPIAVRGRQETEGLIGLFLNILLLRTDLSDDPGFKDLLARVREVALAAYTHQDLPYERLVSALAPERDPSRNPLFQVVVNRLPPLPAPIECAGVTFERLTPPSVGSRFDLTLYIRESPDGVTLYLGYSAELFDADTIVRMLEHLRVLLEGAVADPSRRLSRLPLLSASDRRLLATWHRTDAEGSAEISTHGMVEAQVTRTPDGTAVRMGRQRLTYRELASRADRVARYLRRRGVGPDTLVALCVERSLDLPVGVLGILKAGAAYVPLDPGHPRARLAHILEETRPRLLLTQARLAPVLPPCEGDVLYLEDLLAGPDDEPVVPLVTPVQPDHLAYVVYTSGSTGKPKGVLVRHAGVVSYLTWLRDTYRLSPTDVVLQLPSFSYTAAARDLIGPLTAGGQVILVDDLDARSPDALLRVIRSRRVTCLLAVVPALLDGLVEAARSRRVVCESLRLILVSGEALRAQTVRNAREILAPGALVVNQYGPTECTMNATYCDEDLLQSDGILVPIGRPIPNYRVVVLDRRLNPVPIGVPGELYIGGTGLARGYHARPGLTAERFIPDMLGAEPGGRLYRTGDRARWRPDGTLEFLGRLDHQVKLRGHRVEPGEIEAVIAEHPAVRAAAVVLREDRAGDPQLVAYAVAARDGDGLAGELQAFLRDRLPVVMVPARIELLESLPLTSTGKVDRRALPAPKPLQAAAGLAPRTPVESQVAAVMAQVLGLERLGVDDNFFSLGGHSLLGTQLISRLRDALQVEVPLRTLFEAPTVAGLAAAVEAAQRDGRTFQGPRPQRITRDGPLPLSFAQQRLWFLDRLEPGCSAYNVATAVRLTGPLDPSIVERSLNEVVRRHEALRTRFAIVDDSPAQLIAPELELSVPVLDLQHLSGGEQDAEVRRLALEEAERAFDLTRLPLLRAGVLRLGERDHVLLLSMHHIISDGWSLGVLFRELSLHYQAALENRPAPLAPLEIQYPDYAVWQRRRMRDAELEEHLSYWKRQLGGRLPALRLPTDRPRPPVRTFHGGRCTAVIPPRLGDALEALGRQEDASLFMVLLAAYQMLLARTSRQDDLVVGSPIANRTWAESESLIGFLVNLLALRIDLSGDPTFRELLGRVREVALEAYAHQDLPFDMLVEALQPERDLGRTPIFQALFALHTQPQPALAIPGVVASPLPGVRRTARFDLSLMMRATATGLVTTLDYSSDLFERGTAERMLRWFEALLETIVADPDRRLSTLEFRSEDPASDTTKERDDQELDTIAVTRADEAEEPRPRTALETVLAALWADALGVDRVGVDEDFFELGGHSLLAAILASRLSGALGRDVPVRFLLLHPTVAALARALEEHPSPSPSSGNGAGRSVQSPEPDDRRVGIERRPLVPLITGGEIAPLDAAAISYLPDDLPTRTGLTRGELVHGWHADAPTLRAVLTTSLGRIGSIVLPRFASRLYDDPDDLVGLVLRALELAGRIGARTVSLTGLIPSATGYGRLVAAAAAGRRDLPPVSTGHATTAATVVLAIERVLREAGRSLALEHVGVLGLGSIGLTSLRLMLRRLPHPAELSLCDVYAKRSALEAISRRISEELGFHGPVHLLESRTDVPPAFYDATLMLGATNVAEVLDVSQLHPGTLVVDDSGPHCFSVSDALERLRSSGDILFTEGGVLRAPQPMEALRYIPWTVERAASPAYLESFTKRDSRHITGCVLSSLLSARFADLTPTLGLADDASCVRHYDRLRQIGFQAGDLQCLGLRLDDDAIGRFRRTFGASPMAAVSPG